MKTWFYVLVSLVLIPIVLFTTLLVHEASHALVAKICGYDVAGFSIGIESYVGVFVNYKDVSLIAMGALVLPLIFPLLFIWLNYKDLRLSYIHNLFWAYFCMQIVVVNFGNILAMAINSKVGRDSWDLIKAYDYAKGEDGVFCIVLSVTCLAIAGRLIFYAFKKIGVIMEKSV